MLGIKTLPVDFTYGGAIPAFTAPGLGALELGFQVEEAEMLVDLEARVTYATATPTATAFTFFVDGADVETVGTSGLYLHTAPAAGAAGTSTLYLSKTVRLEQGFHSVEVRLLNAAEAPTLEGATIPCELVARRHSHPATLGHGVDSKVQLIQ